jgi:HTH-type transcriptional regulator/antitoxin HipB
MQIRTPMEIGNLVRDRRKGKGWTQEQLATRVGVSRLWIVQLEQGKATAQIGLVLRALNELDASLHVDIKPTSSPAARRDDGIDLDAIIREASVSHKR